MPRATSCSKPRGLDGAFRRQRWRLLVPLPEKPPALAGGVITLTRIDLDRIDGHQYLPERCEIARRGSVPARKHYHGRSAEPGRDFKGALSLSLSVRVGVSVRKPL